MVSRAGLPVLCALVGLVACRRAPEGHPPSPVVPGSARAPSPPPVLWDRFEEAQSWPAAMAEWAPSAGHGLGDWSVQVRAEPPVAALYSNLGGGSAFAPGSVLVAFHRTASGEPGPIFAMTRRLVGGWSFLAIDPSGRLDPNADLELCARCHAEAPFDGLFGVRPSPGGPVPRPAAASSSAVPTMTASLSSGSAAAAAAPPAPAASDAPLR